MENLDDTSQYFNEYSSDCLKCIHFKKENGFTCPAFSTGIPLKILSGDIRHRKILDTQDNDIIFEELKHKK